MNKVTTIHLAGIAYQLEEAGYDLLRAYLDDATAKLANDPDKDEILKDLEQAIGLKLGTRLSAHKNVLTEDDVKAVLDEMGPVASEGSENKQTAGSESYASSPWPHKKLYRIYEGKMIAGVCTGIAEYFNIDVTLVRILFVLLTILTHGVGILIYFIMMMIVPVARTAKDFEQAAGVPPITAQELIDRAKKTVEDFTNSDEWKGWQSNWRDQKRAWKMQHKAWKQTQKRKWRAEAARYRNEHSYDYGRRHSAVSELFGIACATLAITFVLWFLYGHVAVVHQFFDALHSAYDSLINGLAQLSNK
jgi:phage shock protein PspC (stress-responsive transcriptional regulator)